LVIKKYWLVSVANHNYTLLNLVQQLLLFNYLCLLSVFIQCIHVSVKFYIEIMFKKGVHWVSINTLDWHPDQYLVYNQATLEQQSVNSQPIVNWLVYIDGKIVDSQTTFNWKVDQVIEYWLRVLEGINQRSAADAFDTHDPCIAVFNFVTRGTLLQGSGLPLSSNGIWFAWSCNPKFTSVGQLSTLTFFQLCDLTLLDYIVNVICLQLADQYITYQRR